MQTIFPSKLRQGDEVRIIAPSCARASIDPAVIDKAVRLLEQAGYRVTWGRNTDLMDRFTCAPVAARVEDLHEAFTDRKVQAIMAVRGGYFANQLLDSIDWDIIKNNPKIFCGFSDITVLQNAMLAMTGLVTYSGPMLSMLGRSAAIAYTMTYLRQCISQGEEIVVQPSTMYRDWVSNGAKELLPNPGWWILSEGEAEGSIIGGNLCTLNLLQGTRYMPDIRGSVLFLEDDYTSSFRDFDRNLQSILHLPEFSAVRGIVLGRFQHDSKISLEHLQHMVYSRKELVRIPILANVDFGHTEPAITFPIGGQVQLAARAAPSLVITRH